MIIVEVTGPPGSGKTSLTQHMADAFGEQIHSAQGLTRFAVDHLLHEAEAKRPGLRIVFFDEATPKFKAHVEGYDHLDVRVVLIGEKL